MNRFFGITFALLSAGLLYGAITGHTHHFVSFGIFAGLALFFLSRPKTKKDVL